MVGNRIYSVIILLFSLIFTALFYVYNTRLLFSLNINTKLLNLEQNDNKDTKGQHYEQSCFSLYHKLRFPNISLFFNPALKQPPANLLDEFTQHGQMPIKKWLYINEVYSDSKGNQNKEKKIIKMKEINDLVKKVKENLPLNYDDRVLNEIMHYFKPAIAKRTLAVIGTQVPWIEAIAVVIGCSRIVTLDYTRNKYEHENMEWMHVNDYLDNAMKNRILEQFDTIVSFSSLEHAGLGRYGDPLNPNGDIEAVKQIHCMLKPGGLFFLSLPTNDDGSSHIEFNAHRVYGNSRLSLLFNGWNYLMNKKDTSGIHTIFVLQKKNID